MKRHPALQDLSRDHFTALNAVLDVRRAVEQDKAAKGIGAVWDDFLELTHNALPDHFAAEEALLLPHLAAPGREEHAQRLQADHARLRRSFLRLAVASPDEQTLWSIAQDLRAHVRWEEDELFERLQEWLSEDELEELREHGAVFRREAGMPAGPKG